MPEQSSRHFYLNWAKERIDEMDAVLASLEAKAGQVQADSKAKAAQLIAELKKQRDAFQASLKREAEAREATLEHAKAELEPKWKAFEAQVDTYIDSVGKHVEQQKATFQGVAAAQAKAWRDAVDKIHDAAGKFAAERRADIDAAIKQMKAGASEAEAHLKKLNQAGNESWTVLKGALAESRKAFDHANQVAWEAIKRAAAHKS